MPLRFLTAGESHGQALVGILEGLPSGLQLELSDIQIQLNRRRLGYGRSARMKIESDQVQVLSGVRHGLTLGSPLALLIPNLDHQSWKDEMAVVPLNNFSSQKQVLYARPGHADFAGGHKYNHSDLRNVLERASARETAMRTAIGAVCRKFLRELNIHVVGHVQSIGLAVDERKYTFTELENVTNNTETFCPNAEIALKMKQEIDSAKANGLTLGGTFRILVRGLPIGLGSYVHYDRRLDGILARTLMSIPAIKGVEIGDGFNLAHQTGNLTNDVFCVDQNKIQRTSNHAGGLEGGVTNGQDLILRLAMKPLATLYSALPSFNWKTKEAGMANIERSDTCAVYSACVISENLICFDLVRAVLERFGGDDFYKIKKCILEEQKETVILGEEKI